MLNVHSAGKKFYEKAPPVQPQTYRQLVELILSVLLDIVKVLVLSTVELFKYLTSPWHRKPIITVAGRTALITGGANGIGRAVALQLAKLGCNIIIADIDKSASKEAMDLFQQYEVKCAAYLTDVSNPTAVDNLKDSIEKSSVVVDILVNNAGLMPLLSIREGCPEDLKRIVEVNILGNCWIIRSFLEAMIQYGQGHIVQISSLSALHALPHAVLYSTTKFAVTGLMLALEEELRQQGLEGVIDCTTVHPYFVATRRDLMDAVNLRFPAISVDQAAQEIVRGILRRQRRVIVPGFNRFLIPPLQILPYTIQTLIRDHILREPESRGKSIK